MNGCYDKFIQNLKDSRVSIRSNDSICEKIEQENSFLSAFYCRATAKCTFIEFFSSAKQNKTEQSTKSTKNYFRLSFP